MKCSAWPPSVVRVMTFAGSHARVVRAMMQPTNAARRKNESGFSGILTFSEVGAIRRPPHGVLRHAKPDRSRMSSWGECLASGLRKPTVLRPICVCLLCDIAGESVRSEAKGGRPAPSAPADLFFTLPTSAPTSKVSIADGYGSCRLANTASSSYSARKLARLLSCENRPAKGFRLASGFMIRWAYSAELSKCP